ncbi:MAG: hypothetical protein J7619_23035 [Dyadobacter sp.]|uniref:hypothetical protein n=1 Tax=Dyadobacter sp. TaxID=1914288 RepID=UPI001B09ECD1|nr:hypothetical protein [Dyadobacter sp.]MBO9615590.1 hypothetical protein [Dyadobacter sp.]
MGRRDESIGQTQNPASCFLEWRSDEGTFSFWDKDSETRVPIDLPLRFLVLKQMIRITGFDEIRQQGIYSNEVKDIRYSPFNVRYQDGTPLAKGLYSEIKPTLKAAMAQYSKSIYAMSEKGELICIRIKGQGLMSWENSIGKGGQRWQDEWVSVADFETREHNRDGQTETYSVPIFKFDGSLGKDQDEYAEGLYEQIDTYFKFAGSAQPEAQQPLPAPASTVTMPQTAAATLPLTPEDDDDLPF